MLFFPLIVVRVACKITATPKTMLRSPLAMRPDQMVTVDPSTLRRVCWALGLAVDGWTTRRGVVEQDQRWATWPKMATISTH
jgi:hypothetical protein